MTQQVVRAKVFIPSTVNQLDNVDLDFYVEATGSNANLDFVTATTPQTWIENFFTVNHGTRSIGAYLSPDLSRVANACQVNWTDITSHLDGSPAGAPFRQDLFTLPASAGGFGMPPQIATLCGYRRNYGSDVEHGPSALLPSSDSAIDQGAPATHTGATRPRARDRGRFYLGPISSLCQGAGGGNLDSTYLADVSLSLAFLFATENPGLANQFNLVQWSRRNASVGQVTFYFVDDVMVTQRRRSDPTQARVHTYTAV